MSDLSVVASFDAVDLDSPRFLQDLLPAGEKTALLFHISYLCLAKFPDLERIIRANAVEAQMVFSSSEALLLQCISTSDNMVTTLFPMLCLAVKKNKAMLAVKYLEKARKWIQDIIREVDEMVDEYKTLNRGVSSATSDVYTTKVKTDEKKTKLSKKQEALKQNVARYDDIVKAKKSALAQNEKAIDQATNELRAVIADIASRNRKFGIIAAVVPFLGFIIDAAQRSITSSEDKGRLELARDKITDLRGQRAVLSHDVGQAQTELMHWQFELTKGSIELGVVPDPVHLPEVQQNLTRIQEILLQLKSFWEKISVLVNDLQQKTFAGEDMIEFICEFKEEFLKSIEIASEAWIKFKDGCINVSCIFTVKNKDAYEFLQINPSSLTAVEWQKQYDELKARLENFYQAWTVHREHRDFSRWPDSSLA